MAGKRRSKVEFQILFDVKIHLGKALGADFSGRADVFQRGFRFFVIIGFRAEPGQSQDRRTIGCVADAGESQRSVQRAF